MNALIAPFTVALVGCAPVPATPPIDGVPAADATHASDAPAPRGTFRNPLDAGPDPFLRYHAGHYYLMTTQGDALRMKRAASLAELAVAAPTTIWQDSDPSRNQHVWAPAFYLLDGRWYVYYTADDGIDEHHRLYAIESAGTDPLGPYHFKAKLEPPGATGLFAIDAELLEPRSRPRGPCPDRARTWPRPVAAPRSARRRRSCSATARRFSSTRRATPASPTISCG